jgi:hypothetical protein
MIIKLLLRLLYHVLNADSLSFIFHSLFERFNPSIYCFPTSGGCLVGVVRLWIKATEFSLVQNTGEIFSSNVLHFKKER